MSFEDLPRDWPGRPLSNPVLAADVLDLCVSDRDRSRGGLSVLLCREDDTLAQPVFVGPLEDAAELPGIAERMVETSRELQGVGGVVLAVVRPWGSVNDADRRVHQRAIEVCGALGVRLLGTYVVTDSEISQLPLARELTPHAPGAA